MKLIDLLIQELPKRGGWPEGVDSIHQDHDGEIYAWTGSSAELLFRTGIIADNCRPYGLDASIENMVTRNQYKSVFALSQNPAWNGEGLPPVGCECEYRFPNVNYRSDFSRGKVIAYGNQKAFIEHWSSKNEFVQPIDNIEFRPLLTEAEKKHEAVLESICAVLEMVAQDYKREDEAKLIYEAIAAGKIPGVKLEE
ncbi:TPA: hypothetical protein ACXF76_003700 [Escherichia coli]